MQAIELVKDEKANDRTPDAASHLAALRGDEEARPPHRPRRPLGQRHPHRSPAQRHARRDRRGPQVARRVLRRLRRDHAMSNAPLPNDRLESELADKKPLYSEAEARTEAERCLYCVDAPCIKACPTEIDIPTFIKKIATRQRPRQREDDLRAEPPRLLVRASLPGRGALRRRRASTTAGSASRSRSAASSASRPRPRRAKGAPRPRSGASRSARRSKKVALHRRGPRVARVRRLPRARGPRGGRLREAARSPAASTRRASRRTSCTPTTRVHEVEFVQGLGVEVVTGVEVGDDGRPRSHLRQEAPRDVRRRVPRRRASAPTRELGIPGEDGPGVFGATAWIERMKLEMKLGASRARSPARTSSSSAAATPPSTSRASARSSAPRA